MSFRDLETTLFENVSISCLESESMKMEKGIKALMTFAACAGVCMMSTGCQVHVAGQTLPSPWYMDDDVQYFPAGPENKLANETAAQKAAREEAKARR